MEGKDEGIVVALRLRPLNSKEDGCKPVWGCMPQINSITMLNNEGLPVSERYVLCDLSCGVLINREIASLNG